MSKDEKLSEILTRVEKGGSEKYHRKNSETGKLFARDRIDRLVDVGLPEAGRVVVGRFAVHARIFVPEELDPVGAEDRGRLVRLGHPALPQRLTIGQHPRHRFAVLTPSRRHQHDPVASRDRFGHGAAGRDRLVVGMSMEGHEGCHSTTLSG